LWGNPDQHDAVAGNGCIRTIAPYYDIHETFRLRIAIAAVENHKGHSRNLRSLKTFPDLVQLPA
jgi:hypothetical protein